MATFNGVTLASIRSASVALTPVTIFYSMVEYCDRNRVLTTNRAATFDETFKSKIHLAIRHPKLNEDQVVEIWRDFIAMLCRSKEHVDFADLESNIPHLALDDMNGGQIRNPMMMAKFWSDFVSD